MPLPNDVWCFLVGADSVFSVDIDETRTRTVDHLKEAIKAEMGYSAPAYNLTLYLVTVDGSYDKKTRMNELEGFFQNLKERKELDGWQELSGVFGESPPPGKIYLILVQPSKVVSSISRARMQVLTVLSVQTRGFRASRA